MHTYFAIGHSNRTLEQFVELLLGYDIEHVIDIRTIPRSLRNPQFNGDSLSENLENIGIHYTHLKELGGLRRARPDSPNTGWENASFRGYADYMQTPEFRKGLDDLIALGRKERIVFMCAEAVPWRCHRSLVADALTARGVPVRQIMSRTRAPLHELTSWAKVKGQSIAYPRTVKSIGKN